MAPTKKALVLSGGGGRGAYHIGVIEALVERGWMEDGKGPDIIAGTSIGAINAAALALRMFTGFRATFHQSAARCCAFCCAAF